MCYHNVHPSSPLQPTLLIFFLSFRHHTPEERMPLDWDTPPLIGMPTWTEVIRDYTIMWICLTLQLRKETRSDKTSLESRPNWEVWQVATLPLQRVIELASSDNANRTDESASRPKGPPHPTEVFPENRPRGKHHQGWVKLIITSVSFLNRSAPEAELATYTHQSVQTGWLYREMGVRHSRETRKSRKISTLDSDMTRGRVWECCVLAVLMNQSVLICQGPAINKTTCHSNRRTDTSQLGFALW